MKKLFIPLCIASSLSLAACGVDMTGLSAASTRTPMGPETALVTVTEYGDFQCPACKMAHEIVTKPLMAKYEGRIRLEFKHFPLQSIHANALEAAMGAECAADQGKFWEFFDLAYEKQADLSKAALRVWAEELKLDTALFDRCVKSRIKKETVLADLNDGDKKGVNSTPTYFVNGVRVSTNSLEAVSAAIDTALTSAAQVPL